MDVETYLLIIVLSVVAFGIFSIAVFSKLIKQSEKKAKIKP